MVSKRTKFTNIDTKTKRKVNERDNRQCVTCGKFCEWQLSNSHVVKRSRGGSGGERGIVTQCPECHYTYDFGSRRQVQIMHEIIVIHMKKHYEDWDESELIYRKESI